MAGTVTGVERSYDHSLSIQVDDAVMHPVYRPNDGRLERLYEHMARRPPRKLPIEDKKKQGTEDWLPTVKSFLGPRLPGPPSRP